MDLQLSSTALKVAEAMAAGKRPYVEEAMRYLVNKGASDLHLSAGSAPLVRLHGALVPIPGTPELTAEDTQEMLESFLGEIDKREEFAEDNEVDFSFELDDVARFRVNAYRQRGSMSMVLRTASFSRALRRVLPRTRPDPRAPRAEDLDRIIAEGDYYGMQTFDQSLIQRVKEGLISMDEALKVSSNPSDLKLQAGAPLTTVPGA